ncbi:MAG: molybdenum cofactor guanylyltransferase [Euzebya sp.]
MQASGIVLAGGASRRMGRDKALIRLRGERLVDRAVSRLQQVCDDVIVASGHRTIPGLEVNQVRDAVGVGPLAGLTAGLTRVNHELAFVIAVDLPEASPSLLQQLALLWTGEAAVIPSACGRAQPLHAVWSASAAIGLDALLAEGHHSVIAAAQSLGATFLTQEQTRELTRDDRWAVNVNEPADLHRYFG